MHRLFAFAACLLTALHIVLNITSLVTYQTQVKNTTIDTVDISEIPDGEYIGEADVTFIYAKVLVTVKSGAITSINILEHRNEKGQAAEGITKDIVSQQQVEVDAVSGATNSSTIIKKAVQNALLSEN